MPSEQRQKPTNADIRFMRSIEEKFKEATGLKDRSQYKIFYTPVWPAKIVLLGINPGGIPEDIASDGVRFLRGNIREASSSGSYFENGENDLIDCSWPENNGLLKLLVPLLGTINAIRKAVVKTNLAFARSRSAKNKHFLTTAIQDSKPFLQEILGWVRPELVLLAGAKLTRFAETQCEQYTELAERIEEPSVHQTVFWPARVRLLGGHSCVAVEVAPASQFSWIYEKRDVVVREES